MKMILVVMIFLVAAGCTPAAVMPTATQTSAQPYRLTPYHTATRVLTSTPIPGAPTATALPTATPTPRVHTVKLGEDMSGIALSYRVSLDALKTANPTVNPRILIVGQQLTIPGTTPIPGTPAASPTSPALQVESARCVGDGTGGTWCFSAVKNLKNEPVESVTVRVRVVDDKGKQVAAQVVTTALNLIPAGKSMPVAAYFSTPLAATAIVAVELVNSLPVQNQAARYVGVKIENSRIQLAEDLRSADLSGELVFTQPTPQAKQARVVALAYAGDGNLIGIRRWESGSDWNTGKPGFSLRVYGVGEKIARVELLVEAQP